MKRVLFLIFLTFSLSIAAQDTGILFLPESTIALDKQLHILGSSGIGFVTYIIFEQGKNTSEAEALIYSNTTVLGLGILKEVTDSTGFDFTDIGANQVGALLGSIAAYYLRKWAKKRIRKTQKEKQLEKSIYFKH